MSKLTDHLGKHLRGDIIDKKSVLEYFSTDGSIFQVVPRAVVYPKDTADVRKVTKFSWQLAERGKQLPITIRGKGTDQSGAALGTGLIMVMPAHMNRLLDIDRETITVEPGMLYGDMQRTLTSHGRFLPAYPASMEFSTVGGAVANNACGEKTLKYGCTADYVEGLEVVLANGQVIRTHPLSKRELNRKKGQSDMEGDIYRKIDGLLLDNAELLDQARIDVSKNSAGYALWEIRRPNGTFDLSRLIVGSQGTLGTVTEITFRTESFNPDTHLLTVFFDDLDKAAEAARILPALEPSAMEMVDYHLLDYLQKNHPAKLRGFVEDELPKLVFLVEFDNDKTGTRRRKAKKARKLLKELASEIRLTTDLQEQDDIWKIRRSVGSIGWGGQGKKQALPIIDDAIVPVEKLGGFLEQVYQMFERYNLNSAVWGHAGNAHFHVQPFLDLSNAGDRQTVFKLMDDFYRMVRELGGSTCGEHNDGRLRAPYLRDLYGDEMYDLFRQVKQTFDPHNILNPGVKIGATKDTNRKQMRRQYSTERLYDHLSQAYR